MSTERKLPNNYFHLHGYVKKLFLNEKVGTISLVVEDEVKGKTYTSYLNVTVFGKALETARDLQENQYLTAEGRQSKKKKNEEWVQENVAFLIKPLDKFQVGKQQVNNAYKSAFEDSGW